MKIAHNLIQIFIKNHFQTITIHDIAPQVHRLGWLIPKQFIFILIFVQVMTYDWSEFECCVCDIFQLYFQGSSLQMNHFEAYFNIFLVSVGTGHNINYVKVLPDRHMASNHSKWCCVCDRFLYRTGKSFL